jgi:hypothetical protein
MADEEIVQDARDQERGEAMSRHAAWVLPGRLITNTMLDRYDLIYTLGDRRMLTRPGVRLLAPLCIQDAWEDLENQGASDVAWSSFVARYNLWARDENGNRIQGWCAGRYAVDLSLEAQWRQAVLVALQAARVAGVPDLHMDDFLLIPYFTNRVHPRRGMREWDLHARSVLPSLPQSSSLNGGKGWWALPPDVESHFKVIKYEDCFQSEAGQVKLKDWIEGRVDWGPGLLGLEALGFDVVWERMVPHEWTKDRVDEWGETMLASVMLTDRARVMMHSKGGQQDNPAYPGAWWKTPIWCPSFERSEKLGGHLGPAKRMTNGGWRRQYMHGLVGVNPTDDMVVVPGIGELAPETGKVVLQ